MIGSSTFRSVRKRVLRAILGAAGFEEKGRMYVRHIGNQLHALDVQTYRGLEFCINIAFHYDFLPSFEESRKPAERERLSPDNFGLLDFLLKARLGFWETGLDEWWPLGDDVESAIRTLDEKARLALQVFDDVQKRWADPECFLKLLGPFEMEAIVFVPGCDPEEYGELPGYLLQHWDASLFRLCDFLEILAARKGDSGLAQEYAKVRTRLGDQYRLMREGKKMLIDVSWVST